MKKLSASALFLLSIALVLVFTGCSTSNNTATSTTAGGSATTTLPGAGASFISGTITLPGGLAGHLWIGATTDETFSSGNYHPHEDEYTITASQTTQTYALPMSGDSGTYYVAAVLAVNQSSYPGPTPLAGDRVGEYLDGKVPSNLAQSLAETGTPTAIVYNSGDTVTGKNFELKVTW